MEYPLLDLLELHVPGPEKSWVRAYGRKLNNLFEELLSVSGLSRGELAKLLGVSKTAVQSWTRDGEAIPLKALALLAGRKLEARRAVVESIETLRFGRTGKLVKAVNRLTPELAQIAGAHAADGSLTAVGGGGLLTAEWEIGDSYKENVDAVHEAIIKLFGPIADKPRRRGKMWRLRTRAQVLPRYLVKIFGFPIGEKEHTVSMPKVLKEPRLLLSPATPDVLKELQLAFAKELFAFDGYVTLSGGVVQIGLYSVSSKLLHDVREVLASFKIRARLYGERLIIARREDVLKMYNLGFFRGVKRQKLQTLLFSEHPREYYPAQS
uniref:rRNA intron-encoded endonuclease n=1 Tax=Pyrobaculum sp. M1T TaxID=278051 RepID=Q6L6Z9_9CREN|nr:rRNA intron-encoded endonuclease [Pyrobaculum sp. M1T]